MGFFVGLVACLFVVISVYVTVSVCRWIGGWVD